MATANAAYSQVHSLAGQFTALNVTDANAVNVYANNVVARTLVNGANVVHSVVGYAPSTFATAGIGAVLALNVAAGKPVATGTAGATIKATDGLVQLPTGAIVTAVYADDNGTTVTSGGAATLSLGVDADNVWPIVACDSSALDLTPIAATASGVQAVGSVDAASALGTAGVIANALVAEVPVTVLVNAFALTAGDLRVVIEYVFPNWNSARTVFA